MRSAFLKANSKGILSISLFIIPPNQPDAHFIDIYIKLVVLKKKKEAKWNPWNREAQKMHVLLVV